MPHDDKLDDGVGYSKPPRHSRFVKGRSGNPQGRPPGAKNLKTLLNKALNELVIVTDNGARQDVQSVIVDSAASNRSSGKSRRDPSSPPPWTGTGDALIRFCASFMPTTDGSTVQTPVDMTQYGDQTRLRPDVGAPAVSCLATCPRAVGLPPTRRSSV